MPRLKSDSNARSLPASTVVIAGLILLNVVYLSVNLWTAEDQVRFRNYLVLSPEVSIERFSQAPEQSALTLHDAALIPSAIQSAASKLTGAGITALETATGTVRLLRSQPKRKGPIKSTTEVAFRQITEFGRGYCADYTQVFLGISQATGLIAREWGMSFDNFSGVGHAFNEFWSERLQKWVFVDPLNGFYVTQDSMPLSTLQLHQALSAQQDNRLSVVDIGGAFRFDSEAEAFDYYRQGLDEMWLWHNNDVLAYDRSFAPTVLGALPKSVEQLVGILLGDFPSARILPSDRNQSQIDQLQQFGRFILLSMLMLAVCSMLLVYRFVARRFSLAT